MLTFYLFGTNLSIIIHAVFYFLVLVCYMVGGWIYNTLYKEWDHFDSDNAFFFTIIYFVMAIATGLYFVLVSLVIGLITVLAYITLYPPKKVQKFILSLAEAVKKHN